MRAAWKALSPHQRKEIAQAIRRGRPLSDPRLAGLAVEAAARRYPAAVTRATQLRRGSAIAAVTGLAGVVALALSLAGPGVNGFAVAAGVGLMAVTGWQLRRRRLLARAIKSEEANRDVARRASAWVAYAPPGRRATGR